MKNREAWGLVAVLAGVLASSGFGLHRAYEVNMAFVGGDSVHYGTVGSCSEAGFFRYAKVGPVIVVWTRRLP
jgi:hypothetical protein